MSLKQLLQTYNIYYNIYQHAKQKHAYDAEAIANACREKMLQDEHIDKNHTFYMLHLTQDERSWNSYICFSYGEAMARKSDLTHQRYRDKWYAHALETARSGEIVEISLAQILEDVKLMEELVQRMTYLVPFDAKEIAQIPNEYRLKTYWNFEHHQEAAFIFYDGETFMHSTHKDANAPSFLSWGKEYKMIDEEGYHGIIVDRSVKIGADPQLEVLWEFEHYYLNIEGSLVEVQRDAPMPSDDYRDYICEICNTQTKECYAHHALCGTLEYNNDFLTLEENGLLRYERIDTKKQKRFQSKPYLTILTRDYKCNAVEEHSTHLWGYTDKEGQEIIAPQYDDYAPFNHGYAVVSKAGKDMVIDEEGTCIIPPQYLTILHNGENYFYVKDEQGWAVFNKGQKYIDPVDVEALCDEAFVRDHLSQWMEGEELAYAIKDIMQLDEEEKARWTLEALIKEKKRSLHDKCYALPLKEYMALFDTVLSHKDLEEAGVWMHPVKVKKLPEHYEDMIKSQPYYHIGWSYPASGSMFEMYSELPVMFTKKDGSDLTLGVRLEDLELVREEK